MPSTIGVIPVNTEIVEPKTGTITNFFRLRWEELRNSVLLSNNVANIQLAGLAGSIVPTGAYLTKAAGLYRVSYYLRKTQADGVSSSLQFTYGWTESALAFTEVQPALTLDSTAAEQSGSKLVLSDALADLTYTVTYASNTPGAMQYTAAIVVELLP